MFLQISKRRAFFQKPMSCPPRAGSFIKGKGKQVMIIIIVILFVIYHNNIHLVIIIILIWEGNLRKFNLFFNLKLSNNGNIPGLARDEESGEVSNSLE